MTSFDFKLLDQVEQINLLHEEGVYIGKRKINYCCVLLYQLESFYVEVFYKKYRCSVSKIHCFSSTRLLDPYLEQIDVEHLV
jgi:hypothetical protein